MATVRG
ncbi:hypothetical protein E2C01_023710 [Portunus trituberculatus]|nr:hypothetical protein [Portunus trituberculatus]